MTTTKETTDAVRKLAAKSLRKQGQTARAIVIESTVHDALWELRNNLRKADEKPSEFIKGVAEIMGSVLAAEVAGCKDMTQRIDIGRAIIQVVNDTLTRMIANAVIIPVSESLSALEKEFPSAFGDRPE